MKRSVSKGRRIIIAWLIWILSYILSASLRIIFVGKDLFQHAASLSGFVAVFWHGELFPLAYLHKKQKSAIIVSQSEDGNIQASIMRRYGFAIIRGSSTRGGQSAVLGVLDYLKNGYGIAFAVDGPRGPYHEVKPGAVWIAQKTGVPLIPVTIKFKHCIKLKSWDRFFIPLPFTKTVVIYGEPVSMEGLQRRDGMRIIKQRMEEQTIMAENMLAQ